MTDPGREDPNEDATPSEGVAAEPRPADIEPVPRVDDVLPPMPGIPPPPDEAPFAALDEHSAPAAAAGGAPPPPFGDISLSARKLVGGSFDLMAKAERDLRYMSFYLGFVALVTIGPAVALFWAFIVRYDVQVFDPASIQNIGQEAAGAALWLLISFLIAFVGFLVVIVESQATSVAVLGSRLQGMPLNVSGAVLLARRRFWRVLGASILVGILTSIAQRILELFFDPFDPAQAQVGVVVSLIVTLLIQTPFIYANAGIVLGEVGVLEALRRSTRLFQVRPGLAFTVALFGAATQFLLFFGLGAGLEIVFRIAEPFGLGEGGIAIFLGTIIGATLTFAFGTLAFTAAALASAPQVIAFVGLTHYVGGLEYARVPYEGRRPWDPFITPGLWIAIVLGLVALFLGIAELA
jgi:hypothetical protein